MIPELQKEVYVKMKAYNSDPEKWYSQQSKNPLTNFLRKHYSVAHMGASGWGNIWSGEALSCHSLHHLVCISMIDL